MSVIDDEDRVYAARCAEAADGWPFDADRDDPLTARRIAVTSSHPGWAYLVAFDRESPERPTDHEVDLLVSFLDQYKDYWYGDNGYRRAMERRPLDVDGGANGITFHKWGVDDWGYRRRTFDRGWPFSVVPPWMRDEHTSTIRGPISLLDLLDHIQTCGGVIDAPWWQEWKAAHPEVFIQ